MRARQLTTEGWRERYEAEAAAASAASAEGYNALTKAELQEKLEGYDLPTSGNKAELVARLEEYDAA